MDVYAKWCLQTYVCGCKTGRGGGGGGGLGLAVWLHGEVYICVWLEYRKRGGGGRCTEWGCILIWLQDRKWGGGGGRCNWVCASAKGGLHSSVCGGRCMSWWRSWSIDWRSSTWSRCSLAQSTSPTRSRWRSPENCRPKTPSFSRYITVPYPHPICWSRRSVCLELIGEVFKISHVYFSMFRFCPFCKKSETKGYSFNWSA